MRARGLRKGKLYAPSLKSNPPLTALVPYRTSVRSLRGAAALAARTPQRAGVTPNSAASPAPNPAPPARDLLYPQLPGPTFAAIPFPVRNSPPALADTDAFAPTGVRLGDLRLLPFVEGSTGFESNPNQVQTGAKPSAEFRVDAGSAIESDFSNHSLTGNVRAGYSLFPSNSNADRPDISAILDGRIDVTRDTKINTEARLVVTTQTPGSPLLAVPNSVFITGRPLVTSEGATLGASHQFGRVNLDLRGTFDRTQYGDATQSDGSIFRFSQDNYNDYGVVARASYELTPGIIPFVESGIRRPRPRQRSRPVRLPARFTRHPRPGRLELRVLRPFHRHVLRGLCRPALRRPTAAEPAGADGRRLARLCLHAADHDYAARQHHALGNHAGWRLGRDLQDGQPRDRPRLLPPFYSERHRHLSAQRIPGASRCRKRLRNSR